MKIIHSQFVKNSFRFKQKPGKFVFAEMDQSSLADYQVPESSDTEVLPPEQVLPGGDEIARLKGEIAALEVNDESDELEDYPEPIDDVKQCEGDTETNKLVDNSDEIARKKKEIEELRNSPDEIKEAREKNIENLKNYYLEQIKLFFSKTYPADSDEKCKKRAKAACINFRNFLTPGDKAGTVDSSMFYAFYQKHFTGRTSSIDPEGNIFAESESTINGDIDDMETGEVVSFGRDIDSWLNGSVFEIKKSNNPVYKLKISSTVETSAPSFVKDFIDMKIIGEGDNSMLVTVDSDGDVSHFAQKNRIAVESGSANLIIAGDPEGVVPQVNLEDDILTYDQVKLTTVISSNGVPKDACQQYLTNAVSDKAKKVVQEKAGEAGPTEKEESKNAYDKLLDGLESDNRLTRGNNGKIKKIKVHNHEVSKMSSDEQKKLYKEIYNVDLPEGFIISSINFDVNTKGKPQVKFKLDNKLSVPVKDIIDSLPVVFDHNRTIYLISDQPNYGKKLLARTTKGSREFTEIKNGSFIEMGD